MRLGRLPSAKFRFEIDILQTEETAAHTILFYDAVDDYERRRTMFREQHLSLARDLMRVVR